VSVELGGLARTDNSGWGDEFERLTDRLLGDEVLGGAPERDGGGATGPALGDGEEQQ
jgi:hypothetical protein